ncbi:uncharacterized protein DUF3397 [Thermolongibacillus altinsuensis]|jgi:hypothetical protein|uniref:Uncharacterized protein DUF3397 n=1 Tax=Thermolongibacillus altinsuensis TaxID=575256 RepID=A0A4R1QEV4_9BACL|nr:DUF3397 domain-containing protein [Thermolongibacillus altinsuensis]TCL50271.1 uncharacterized protein DUF3397 [Thermolongibacillus altinsuensis]GMB08561.1 hypothetical protein B1no1_12710 [Thermolongibacillus altinsuensis]
MIKQFISGLLTLMVTIPLFSFIFIYIGAKKIFKQKVKRSFQLAVDGSTIFFILSVHFLIIVIFGRSYGMELLLFLIVTMIMFIIGYWKKTGDVQISKIFKIYWKAHFLLFAAAYISLLAYGLFSRILIELS